jgi:hypothetical protein
MLRGRTRAPRGNCRLFESRKEKSRQRRTVCWREMDSNFQYASIVRWHQATDLPLPPSVEEERSESGRAVYRAMSR